MSVPSVPGLVSEVWDPEAGKSDPVPAVME